MSLPEFDRSNEPVSVLLLLREKMDVREVTSSGRDDRELPNRRS